ncbi:MAG: hypothetical protein ACOX6W_08905 [Lentisphaeria bacterium]
MPVRVAGVVGAVVDAEERFGVGAVLDDDFPPGVSFHADRRRMAGVVVLQAAPPAARVADGVVECVGRFPAPDAAGGDARTGQAARDGQIDRIAALDGDDLGGGRALGHGTDVQGGHSPLFTRRSFWQHQVEGVFAGFCARRQGRRRRISGRHRANVDGWRRARVALDILKRLRDRCIDQRRHLSRVEIVRITRQVFRRAVRQPDAVADNQVETVGEDVADAGLDAADFAMQGNGLGGGLLNGLGQGGDGGRVRQFGLEQGAAVFLDDRNAAGARQLGHGFLRPVVVDGDVVAVALGQGGKRDGRQLLAVPVILVAQVQDEPGNHAEGDAGRRRSLSVGVDEAGLAAGNLDD